jgi:hypothetical protein
MIPTRLELKLLQALCLGSVEDPRRLTGVGPKTIRDALAKGWISEDTCDHYGTQGLRITPEGLEIHRKNQ